MPALAEILQNASYGKRRRFNYAAFIPELQELEAAALEMSSDDRRAESEFFRSWKHHIIDLISQI